MTEAVRGYVESQLEGARKESQQLRDNLSALRSDMESKDSESWRQDVERLDKDVEALRDFVQKSTEIIWQRIDAQPDSVPAEPPTIPKEEGKKAEMSSRRTPEEKPRGSSRRRRATRQRKAKRVYTDSESESHASDSMSESDVGSDSETDDIRTADSACRKALSVETYRLNDRSTRRSKRWTTSKVLNTVRHLFKGDNFDGSDPINVLIFLEEVKSAFDDADIGEGDAKHLVRYFLEGDAERLFKGLGSRDRSSYPRILRWLLRTYVRETMLQDAREAFLTRTQRSNESELDYSKELRVLARRCGGIIPERDIIHRFVRGLQPGIRTQVQMQVSRRSTWPTVVALAADFGNSLRDASRVAKTRDESRYLVPARRRSSETGRALLAQTDSLYRPEHSSDDEELLQFGSLGDPEDGSTVAVLQPSMSNFPRTPSHYSISSGAGSSGTYQTARGAFSPSPATFASPREARKVMLPPGVPFPARQPANKPQPRCWGCGMEGHFLSGCQTTDPRLIEVALAGLRARKRERDTRVTPSSQNHLSLPERSAVYERAANRHTQPPQSFPVRSDRAMLVKDDSSEAQASEPNPANGQDTVA